MIVKSSKFGVLSLSFFGGRPRRLTLDDRCVVFPAFVDCEEGFGVVDCGTFPFVDDCEEGLDDVDCDVFPLVVDSDDREVFDFSVSIHRKTERKRMRNLFLWLDRLLPMFCRWWELRPLW